MIVLMTPDWKEVLEGILKKNPEDLTYDEIGFLNARRTYLNNEQKRIFSSVLLKEKPVKEEVKPVEESPVAVPAEGVEQAPPTGIKTDDFSGDGKADPDVIK
jgi:hypothetical protein